ncbi:zinc finger BED domain-containing protein RICESLEEPER 2-like [Rhizophagus clarus]|uniref:Zinc finger BED domain-containing protein RICESLEEPER 2-like n=1 Tax=Rhizophagus clarus TaxID=94130 RepID=A0A8H3MGG0_9GLOM|nr:zinc finger BED domain-containing protein RICESLEEPER 2-like [Rhizophagus clarus]
MKKAHSILQKDYPNIIFLGCFAHNINLLIKSVIELALIKETITPVQEIIKFFKRHHIENACLERLQIEKIGKTIKFNLPVITRWGSHYICLQSFLASKKALQNVVFEECVRKSIPSSLNSKLIDTEGFWVNIEEICQLLEPFTKIIREFESNQPNLSLVYDRFTKLKNEIKQLTNTSLKDIILDKCTLRWEKMYHPAIVIAYYLDPRYHGQDLIDEYLFSMIAEETSKFVNQDLSGQLVKELLWYNNKTGPFNSSIFWKLEAISNPIDWWNGFQQEVPVLTNGQKLNDDNINEEELENLDEIIVIEESEESNIEH